MYNIRAPIQYMYMLNIVSVTLEQSSSYHLVVCSCTLLVSCNAVLTQENWIMNI